MKRLVLLLCFGIIAHARPSLPVNVNVGKIIKGPNSETIIKGPDGSVITAEAGGGSLAVEASQPAVGVAKAIVDGGTVIASASSNSISLAQAPIIVPDVPVLSRAVIAATPIIAAAHVPVVAPAVAVAPIVTAKNSASLEGPSGSVLRVGEDAVISGPSSTTIREGQVVSEIKTLDAVNVPVANTVAIATPGPILAPTVTVNSLANAAEIAQIAALENEQRLADAALINAAQANAVNADLLARQQAVLENNARVIAATGPRLTGVNGVVAGIQPLPQGYAVNEGRAVLASQEAERALAVEAERNAIAQAVASNAARDRLLVAQEVAERNAVNNQVLLAQAQEAAERNAVNNQILLAQAQEAERNAAAQKANNQILLAQEAERNAINNQILLQQEAERNTALAQEAERNAVLAQEAERNAILAQEAERNAILAQEAERNAILTQQAQRNAALAQEAEINAALARANHGINPVITQGGQIVGDIQSTTLGPLVAAGNIGPTKLRRVGPNGNIVSSTFRPILSTTGLSQIAPGAVVVSSTPQPLDVRVPTVLASNVHNRGPIVLQPDGVPVGGLGDWRGSVAEGHIAAQAVLPKQIYRGVIH